MEEVQRKKQNPITDYERQVLLQLVEKFKDIVECKKTNHNFNSDKERAWENIAQIFNEDSFTTKRTAKQLLECYRHMKKATKKTVADIREDIRRTGGGPYIPQRKLTTVEEKIISLDVLTVPLDTPYDSNAKGPVQVTSFLSNFGLPSTSQDTTTFVIPSVPDCGTVSTAVSTASTEGNAMRAAIATSTKVASPTTVPSFKCVRRPLSVITNSPQMSSESSSTPTAPKISTIPPALSLFRKSARKPSAPSRASRTADAIHDEASAKKRVLELEEEAIKERIKWVEEERVMKKYEHERRNKLLEEEHDVKMEMFEMQMKTFQAQAAFFTMLTQQLEQDPHSLKFNLSN